MSEIYHNTAQSVFLDIYGGTADGTPTAHCFTIGHDDHLPDLTVNGPEVLDNGAQRWTATLTLAHTQRNEEIVVEWHFTMGGVEVTKKDYFDVVTPLASPGQIYEALDIADYTEEEVNRAERKVRKIVENYCGQKFMETNEVLHVTGNGTKYLKPPKRIIAVNSIRDSRTGILWTGSEIRNDGWSLGRPLTYMYEDALEAGVTVIGPIYAPFRQGVRGWPEGIEWAIDGRWGWERVPSAVHEAALILIEQNLCDQSNYRDQYLTAMKAADWRIDFSPSAYIGTGNVVADQLLSKYMVSGVTVF